jgi:uncharacterized protein YdhG (YjbR/CyaY superfamily)
MNRKQTLTAAPGQTARPSREIEAYLASVPQPARATLTRLREAIRAAAPPAATESISYGIPTFNYNGPLIGFAAFPNHCSLYPMSATTVDTFRDELKNYQTSKGTIRFPVDQLPPTALIKKIVEARLAENALKKHS